MIIDNHINIEVDNPLNQPLSQLITALRLTEQLKLMRPEDLRTLVQLAAESGVIDAPSESAAFLQHLSDSLRPNPPSVTAPEITRAADPKLGESLTIAPENTLIVPKLSKIEWDLLHSNLNYSELINKYKQDDLDVETIVSAHISHTENVDLLKSTLQENPWIQPTVSSRADLLQAIAQSDLVVVLGGDDHFKYMNQFLDDKFVVVANSDPEHSDGAAAYFEPKSLIEFLKDVQRGEFLIEEWQRLSVSIDGKTNHTAISEIVIAEELFKYGSRGSIDSSKQEYNFKGSGAIFGTGYGSTGWFKSAARYIKPELKEWPRTARYAHWVEREPYGDISYPHITNGQLLDGEQFQITSRMNHNGILTVDSIVDLPFPRGAKATIGHADKPLKVLQGGSA